jgi:hypothetical protein
MDVFDRVQVTNLDNSLNCAECECRIWHALGAPFKLEKSNRPFKIRKNTS